MLLRTFVEYVICKNSFSVKCVGLIRHKFVNSRCLLNIGDYDLSPWFAYLGPPQVSALTA
jgi:hypothetical protein